MSLRDGLQFWYDLKDWVRATWAKTTKVTWALIALGIVVLCVARACHAQATDSARVEGLSVRFSWASIAGADSARLTVLDSVTGKSYINSKVSTRTRTRAVTIPVKGTSYRAVERCLHVWPTAKQVPPICRFFPQYTVRDTTPTAPVPVAGPIDWSQPLSASLPTDPSQLVALGLVGPTLTAAQGRALGGPFATYENEWVQWSNTHWNSSDSMGNYYDRAWNHYALWLRTGDPVWRHRADSIAVNYRTTYLEAVNYGTSPHNLMIDGIALHYWLTGDTMDQKAIVGVAKVMKNYLSADPDYRYQEGRIQARSLLATLYACLLKDSSADWCGIADQFINNWVALQRPDGSFRYRLNTEDANSALGQSNFMEGLRADAMMKYYRLRRQDPRVLAMVTGMANFMATQWQGDSVGSFLYWSAEKSQPDPRLADLNHLILPIFGFAYYATHDARYRAIGDAAFDGGEPPFTAAYLATGAGTFLNSSKQFNEHFYDSFLYLWYRQS